MPPYQPAVIITSIIKILKNIQVFPPQFRELPQPQLELFELDDAFCIKNLYHSFVELM